MKILRIEFCENEINYTQRLILDAHSLFPRENSYTVMCSISLYNAVVRD